MSDRQLLFDCMQMAAAEKPVCSRVQVLEDADSRWRIDHIMHVNLIAMLVVRAHLSMTRRKRCLRQIVSLQLLTIINIVIEHAAPEHIAQLLGSKAAHVTGKGWRAT